MGQQNPFPPLLLTVVVLALYGGYMVFNVLPQLSTLGLLSPLNKNNILLVKSAKNLPGADPQYVYEGTYHTVISSVIAFHVFFVLFIISFLRAVFTAPGTVPRNNIWLEANFEISEADEKRFRAMIDDASFAVEHIADEDRQFVRQLPVSERKIKDAQFRYCHTCEVYKPDRTHHCRVCDKCVLRMDHHCPWIANCVGYMNYKFFLLFVFYGVFCDAFLLVTMFPRLLHAFRPPLDWGFFFTHDVWVIISYAVCLLVFMALSIFCAFHIYITAHAMSNIEFREKKHVAEVRHRFEVAHLKFSDGFYKNLVHVLGPVWMWLLPIQPSWEDDALAGYDPGTYCNLKPKPKTYAEKAKNHVV
jgi:hypothetical protein